MGKVHFEWDEAKDRENQKKHGVSFELAQYAFADPKRVIAEDLRIFGAGYWRKGRKIYEEQNQIY